MSPSKHIYLVVGDIGACKELIPVAELLTLRKHTITWVVDPKGKAGDVLEKAKINFLTHNDRMLNFTNFTNLDLVLVGTSVTACETQNQWTDYLKRKCHIVWYEDLYGTGEVVSVRGCLGPDTFITIDEVAQKIAATVWRDSKVVVGGKPTYGNTLATLIQRRRDLRRSLRFQLNLEKLPDTPIVTYASMGESVPRVQAHIRALGQAFDRGEKVIVRLHPKLKTSFEVLMKEADNCLGDDLIDSSMIEDTTSVIVGSDMVVSDFGGDAPYQAALAGIPVIMTMFPDCSETLKIRGYPNGVPPLLHAGACWGARDANDMEVLAAGLKKAPLAASARVRETIKPFTPLLNSDAAGRIVDIVESCFNA